MAACYFPGGKNQNGAYIPCNNTAVAEGKHSACCNPGDLCFTNGLCKANSDNQFNWNWRVGCTDPTWQDPACPNYCRGMSEGANHVVFQCQQDALWCCAFDDPPTGHYNFTCCTYSQYAFNAGKAVVYTTAQINLAIASSIATFVPPSSSAATTLSIPTSILSQPSASPTPSVPQIAASATQTALSPSTTAISSKSPSLAIGLGVGIPLAVLLFAVACFAFWRLGQRQTQRAQPKSDQSSMEIVPSPHSMPAYSATQQERDEAMEIDSDMLKAELAHPRSPVELEGPKWPSRSPSRKVIQGNFF